MVTAIFTELQSIITSLISLLTGVFNGVAGLIYTAGVGDASGSLTLFGTLLLISAGSGILFFGLRWIIGLIKVRMN